jgi:hypothetical protein
MIERIKELNKKEMEIFELFRKNCVLTSDNWLVFKNMGLNLCCFSDEDVSYLKEFAFPIGLVMKQRLHWCDEKEFDWVDYFEENSKFTIVCYSKSGRKVEFYKPEFEMIRKITGADLIMLDNNYFAWFVSSSGVRLGCVQGFPDQPRVKGVVPD